MSGIDESFYYDSYNTNPSEKMFLNQPEGKISVDLFS